MTPVRNTRLVAAQIIRQWLVTGDFPDRLVDEVLEDRAFVMELVYGVVRWRRLIEWAVARYASRPPDLTVLPFLQVGIYQLLFMDRTADYAAVNETVAGVKVAGADYAVGFVNRILREVQRDRARLMEEVERQADGVRWSHPDLLLSRWRAQFGAARTAELCAWNNRRPDVIIRVNRAQVQPSVYRAALEQAGVQVQPHPFSPENCWVLAHGTSVASLPGYADGHFVVQDPSTLGAPLMLGAKPGDRVLDACAAPGGKTSVLAECLKGEGRLVAMELHRDRLRTLQENLVRLRHEWVEVVQGDATDREGLARLGLFDRILLDVPCTNSGVLRRRPDARWRFSLERMADLNRTQRALLDAAGPCLKPGGRMVYSTCSLEPEEGRDLVASWLDRQAGFRLEKQELLFPPQSQTDGAFIAVLSRNPHD